MVIQRFLGYAPPPLSSSRSATFLQKGIVCLAKSCVVRIKLFYRHYSSRQHTSVEF